MEYMSTVSWQLADASGWDHMNGWGWGMAIFGLAAMATFIVLAAWAVSSISRANPTATGTGRARDILAERYASGDIDRDEYLARSKDLES